MKPVVYLVDVLDLIDEYIQVYSIMGQTDIKERFELFRHAIEHRVPIVGSIEQLESL